MQSRDNDKKLPLPYEEIKGELTENFDLNNKEYARKFAENAQQILNLNNIELVTNSEAATVYYDPSIFTDVDYKNQIEVSLHTRKKLDKFAKHSPEIERQRTKSKHHIEFSKVKGYATANGKCVFDGSIEPYNYYVTTTRAPNGMGSNDEDVATYFSDHQAQLELPLYKEMMKLTYLRCLHIQIKNGVNVVVIPPVGLGLYLKVLKTKDEKNKTHYEKLAIAANYQALREAIDASEDKGKIQQIICAMPNKGESNSYYEVATNVFKDCLFPVELAKADVLEIAQKLSQIKVKDDNGQEQTKYKIGLINAGSDATIGGAYRKINSNELPHVEESIAQSSNYVRSQAKDKRTDDYTYHPFPEDLQIKKNPVLAKVLLTSATTNDRPLDTLNNLPDKIQNWLGLESKILVEKVGANYKIKFQYEGDALLFVNKLANEMGICSQKEKRMMGTRVPKKVQSGDQMFFVMLTQKNVGQLEQSLSKEKQKEHIDPMMPSSNPPAHSAKNYDQLASWLKSNSLPYHSVMDVEDKRHKTVNTGVLFDLQPDASKFVDLLKNMGIQGRSGARKQIHMDNKGKFFVILTNKELDKIGRLKDVKHSNSQKESGIVQSFLPNNTSSNAQTNSFLGSKNQTNVSPVSNSVDVSHQKNKPKNNPPDGMMSKILNSIDQMAAYFKERPYKEKILIAAVVVVAAALLIASVATVVGALPTVLAVGTAVGTIGSSFLPVGAYAAAGLATIAVGSFVGLSILGFMATCISNRFRKKDVSQGEAKDKGIKNPHTLDTLRGQHSDKTSSKKMVREDEIIIRNALEKKKTAGFMRLFCCFSPDDTTESPAAKSSHQLSN